MGLWVAKSRLFFSHDFIILLFFYLKRGSHDLQRWYISDLFLWKKPVRLAVTLGSYHRIPSGFHLRVLIPTFLVCRLGSHLKVLGPTFPVYPLITLLIKQFYAEHRSSTYVWEVWLYEKIWQIFLLHCNRH